MKIKILNKKNILFINQLAFLHAKNIPGKLSIVGAEFLARIYLTFLSDKNCKIWVLIHNLKIEGFLCAAINNEKIYLKFIFKNFPFLAFFITRNIFNFFVLKALFNLMVLMFVSNEKKSYNSELLAIAISKRFRNQSHGKKLVKVLEVYLRKKNIKNYIVKVGVRNRKAVNFYLKQKFKHHLRIKGSLFNMLSLKKKL